MPIKVVSKFQCELPKETLKGLYDLQLSTALDDTINTYLSGKFDQSFTFQKRAPEKVIFLAGPYADGSIAYEAYPKIILTVKDRNMKMSEFIDYYNNTAALIRIALVEFLSNNGCYDVTTYIQYTGGEVVVKETF